MNEQITIERLRELKKNAEDKILFIIQDLEKETGCEVTTIERCEIRQGFAGTIVNDGIIMNVKL